MSTRMIELESQQADEEAAAVETMKVATPAHVATTVALRLTAFAASLAAALVVVTNRQDRWGITVSFDMFDVWVAFVAMNFACAAYSLLTALLVKKLLAKSYLHHLDQWTVNLQSAAMAGAGAVGSVAMWGNEPSGWFPVCRLYHLYCDKGVVALVLAGVAILALAVASALSRCTRAPPPPEASG